MNRRDFLESVALASALKGQSWAASDKANAAIVGVGGRGRGILGNLARRNDVNLVAVCDVDTTQTERAVQMYYSARNIKPRVYGDLRKLYEDKDIDIVFICTPTHWHALAASWACQAGKDVYVEKPVSYNPFEGERMVAAARRYNRIVQSGGQRRSLAHKQRAIQLLRQEYIGKLYMARGLCFKRRQSIGHKPDGPVPAGLNWDLFLGPAPLRPYNENRYLYKWNWFWDTGCGDIGNQGIHELDYARWGLNKAGNPKTVYSSGGKYVYDDDQETPNTQIAIYDYGDCELAFEVRGLMTGGESGLELREGHDFVGNLFYGSKGYMVVEDSGFKSFLGDKREPGEAMNMVEPRDEESTPHVTNFLQAVRSRRREELVAEVHEGALSADLVHMANASFRTKRKLTLEAGSTRFVGDEEANRYLKRHPYRSPYIFS
jgi:predicted dehydrogenase